MSFCTSHAWNTLPHSPQFLLHICEFNKFQLLKLFVLRIEPQNTDFNPNQKIYKLDQAAIQ